MTVSFGSDQIPPRSSVLSLPLPGTSVYIHLLQVSFYSVFKSEPWSTPIIIIIITIIIITIIIITIIIMNYI